MVAPLLHAEVAYAQSQGWAGIVPGSNDYSNPVPHATPAEACASHENSFVPYFGYQVFGVISVSPMADYKNTSNGVPAPATACRMDAGPNGTPTIVSLKGCTDGYKLVNGACLPADYPVTAEPMCDNGCKGIPGQFPAVGDPVSLSTGSKVEEITDYTSGGPYPIEIKRYYRSMNMPRDADSVGFGLAWRANLVGRKLRVDSSNYNIVISREDGGQTRFLNPDSVPNGVDWSPYSIETYIKNGSTYVQGQGDARDRFHTESPYYVYQDENDRLDYFRGRKLEKTVWKGGYQRNYVYATGDTNGLRPIQINDSLGRVVNITWNGNLVSEIVLPDGTRLQYSYQAHTIDGDAPSKMVLTQVARLQADGTPIDTRGYQYEAGRPGTQVPLLTGVTDAKGVTIDSTTYDDIGRVLTAQGPAGANAASIAYNDSNNSRTVTNALGQVEIYTFAKTGGAFPGDPNTHMLGMTSVARQQSATVAAATKSIGTDFDGWADPPDDYYDASMLGSFRDRLYNEKGRLGATDEDIRKITGLNLLRVLEKGWS